MLPILKAFVSHRGQQTCAQDLGRRRRRHFGLEEPLAVQPEALAGAGTAGAARPLRRLHPVVRIHAGVELLLLRHAGIDGVCCFSCSAKAKYNFRQRGDWGHE